MTRSPVANPQRERIAIGPLLTLREVANMLRVSSGMVRRLTRRGDLPAVYIGRLPRYHEADVAAYLENQRTRGAAR